MQAIPQWKRIWQGPDQVRAHQTVDEVLAALVKWASSAPPSHSFAEILLLAAVVSARRELEFDVSELANRALEASGLPVAHTLFDTLSFGLTLQHALSLLGTELDDVCTLLDEGLHATLTTGPRPEYDLIKGAAGRLVYLSHRPDTQLNQASCALLFDALATMMRSDERGCWWELEGENKKDIGLAHGSAGVVSALAACVTRGWAHEREKEWLTRGVDYLLAHRNSPPAAFIFPYRAGGMGGRLGWCYCDLGIALALLHAARAMNRTDWAREGLRVALHAADIAVADAGVRDASLCHGAAGAGLMLANLAYQTGSDALWRSSTQWFNRVESFRQTPSLFGGFRFLVKDEFIDRSSLLEGATGIALGLELACSDEPPAWPGFYRFA